MTEKKPRLLFPYADGLDLGEFEEVQLLDTSAFLGDIGSQVSPMFRLVLTMLNSVTAAHKSTLPLDIKNEYVR